ncbi:hypothetical protein HGT73_11095 [Rosenbergiella australiborealis]|uniref:AraC-type arabinose-binding/dimerisation domain-containing protein n=1 Tax=Rosenbergiella australiborealis TaxID=1544696 RepID=A0ABS5T6D1_9GAMM|nr:AraC family ligand binding domain-containing protein [Rosenbergiella australiborealis]MBT0727910.1 hypothetical protein [Rosenbergiella australiborealis]
MNIGKLELMHKGWFIGNFIPSLYPTCDVEVAVKYYQQGDHEPRHTHKIATEITVIIEGEARMDKNHLKKGDIITLLPGEETDFHAITNVTTVVVKLPSVKHDKYMNIE